MSRRTYLLIGTSGSVGYILYIFITLLIAVGFNLDGTYETLLATIFGPLIFGYVICFKKILKYKDTDYIRGINLLTILSILSLAYTFSNFVFAIFPLINIIMYFEAWRTGRKEMKKTKK